MNRYLAHRAPAGLTLTLAGAALGLAGCAASQAPSSAPVPASPARSAPAPSTPAPAAPASSATGAARSGPAPAEPAAALAAPRAARPASRCAASHRWTTAAKDGGTTMNSAALYLARAGRHACYDRVVFDVNGPAATGFAARYVRVVQADASGAPVPVAGRAALELVVRAPIDDEAGHQPWRPALRVGDSMLPAGALAGFPQLRAVAYAGSFEGQTTIAVGVRDRRPFRVFTLASGGYRRVVVDIAR